MVVIDVITLDDDDDDVGLQKPRYGIFKSIRGDDDTPIQNPDNVPWKIEEFFFSSEDVMSSGNSEALRDPKIEESEGILNPSEVVTSSEVANPKIEESESVTSSNLENSKNPTSSGNSGAVTSSGAPTTLKNFTIPKISNSGHQNLQNSKNPTSSGSSEAATSSENSEALRDPKIEESEFQNPSKSQNSKIPTSSRDSGAATSSRPLQKSHNHQNSSKNQNPTSSGAATSSGLRNPKVLRDPKIEEPSESQNPLKSQNSKNPTSSRDSGAPTTLKNFGISNSGIPSLLEIPLIPKPRRIQNPGNFARPMIPPTGNSTSSGHQNHQNPSRIQNSTSSGGATSSRPLQKPQNLNSGDQNPREFEDFPVLALYKDPKKMSRGERRKYRRKLQLEAVMVAGQIKQLRMLSAQYMKQEDQEVTQFQRANQEKLSQLILQDTQIRTEFQKACGSTVYLDELIKNAGCAGYIPKPSPPPANTSDHPKRTFPSRDVTRQNPEIPEKRIKVETC